MSQVIYKYSVPLKDKFSIELPWGYQILKFDKQNDEMFLWIIVNLTHAKDEVNFEIIGTGQEVKGWHRYIGTVFMNNNIVWHLFEKN